MSVDLIIIDAIRRSHCSEVIAKLVLIINAKVDFMMAVQTKKTVTAPSRAKSVNLTTGRCLEHQPRYFVKKVCNCGIFVY